MAPLINIAVALAIALVAPAVAYPEYIAELPTHPRYARGVGHVSPGGGGLRNKFGQVSALYPPRQTAAPPLHALLAVEASLALNSGAYVLCIWHRQRGLQNMYCCCPGSLRDLAAANNSL